MRHAIVQFLFSLKSFFHSYDLQLVLFEPIRTLKIDYVIFNPKHYDRRFFGRNLSPKTEEKKIAACPDYTYQTFDATAKLFKCLNPSTF